MDEFYHCFHARDAGPIRILGENFIDSADGNDLLTGEMDLPQLESAIKALEKSLDSLSVWLTVWTALVVLGLGVELADDLRKIVKERPVKWTKHLLVIGGGLLITIGVAGELFVQFKASKVETFLRADSHQVEALLNQQAAEANKEAEEVRSEAASALIQIAQAKKDAELARRDAESFKLDIAKANERAAEASQKAEEERLARLRIEETLAPRRISAEQTAALVADLKPLTGKKVFLSFITGDPETAAFTELLRTTLAKAGLVVEARAILIFGSVQPGITMTIGKDRLADANFLANALIHAGLVEKPVPAEKLPEGEEGKSRWDELTLVIGPKR